MEMTMKMPANYVEMTDEEMMYIDGGRMNFFGQQWWNTRGNVANGVDIALILWGLGSVVKGGNYVAKHAIKTYRSTIVSAINKVLGSSAAAAAWAGIEIALTLAGTTVGGLVAGGLDYADGSYNGYVFG